MQWQATTVTSPHVGGPVDVIAAKDVHYVPNGHRFQTLSIYLRKSEETEQLVGQQVTFLPTRKIEEPGTLMKVPQCHVHIHGGAWRNPQLTAATIEAAVAHEFSATDAVYPITSIISINYTLSPFPTDPILPYDPIKNDHSDPSREAGHPTHVHDVLRALNFMRSDLGVTDGSYVLSGHSAGSCLAMQSILQTPTHWGFDGPDAPAPAAILGMNGLYDLPGLVDDLGPEHVELKPVYDDLISIAFGKDRNGWLDASPTATPVDLIAQRMKQTKVPRLIILDQSPEDQLVPMNQTEKLEALLKQVDGLMIVRGHRCTGVHAAPWEQGYMIWESVQDMLGLLQKMDSAV